VAVPGLCFLVLLLLLGALVSAEDAAVDAISVNLLAFLTNVTKPESTSSAPPSPEDPRQFGGVEINEVQHSDRAGGPDWVELVNRGDGAVDLSGLVVELRDDSDAGAVWRVLIGEGEEGCESLGVLKPKQYLVVAGETKKPELFLSLRNRVYRLNDDSARGPEASQGACRDVRPKGSSAISCSKQKEWNKCQESWMVEGGYCSKTCGRCTPTLRHYVKEAGTNADRELSGCKLLHNLHRAGQMRLRVKGAPEGGATAAAGLDKVGWETPHEDELGFTLGRPLDGAKLEVSSRASGGVQMLSYLREGTPGGANEGRLTRGPLGPHWHEEGGNPFLSDAPGTREFSFKSNLPLAIVKTARGIPNDPKMPSHLWLSGCSEFGDSSDDHVVSSAVKNRDNLICSLRDEAAYSGKAGIELRGRSSQRYPKKQYSFEFWDQNHNGIELAPLGLPPEEDWVLGAPYVDRSLMRDALAFDMFRGLGRWAPAMQFIELFVMEGDGKSHVDYGDHYKGIYLLKEKIKRGSNRVAVSKMDPLNRTDVSGGYLLVLSSNSHDSMLNTGEPQKQKVLDEGPARVSYVYPKIPTGPQHRFISNYLSDFQQALWGPGFAGPEGYSKYIDVDSWIDYFLHTEVSKNLDGYISSVYLHKDKDSKLVAGPAWDYNLAFGQATYWNGYYVEPWDFTYIGPNQKSYSQMVHWYYRLLQDPAFVRRLSQRYEDLRRTVWKDSDVVASIRSYRALLSNSQGRNFGVWPISQVSTNHKYIPIKYWGPTWDQNVRGLQDWVLRRLHWMDEWVPRL